MWKVSAALGYCVRDAGPSLGVRNRAAPGRSATWSEGEIARLFKRAWRDRYHGLAAVIAVAWATQLSPGDVRALRASQLVRDGAGALFFTARGKTGVNVAALSATAPSPRWRHTSRCSASSYTARPMSSATAVVALTPATLWATTFATFVVPCSVTASSAHWPTSGAPVPSKHRRRRQSGGAGARHGERLVGLQCPVRDLRPY